jgi:hypothetical protein
MIWMGLAFLSTSWLFALGYYHPVDYAAWVATLALGVLCLLGGPVRPHSRPTVIVGALLLSLPSLFLLPQPYRTAVALLAAGLAFQLVVRPTNVARWSSIFTRAAGAFLSAGSILLAQAVAIRCYTGLTARSHELVVPLPQLLAVTARAVGIDAAQHENTISMHSMRRIHQLAATWELFLDPVTFCFLVGVLAVFAWFIWQGLWNRRQLLVGLGVLAAGMLIWLPLRSGALMALYLHDVLRTDYGATLDGPEVFWNSWLHLALLAGPVAICWRFLPRAVAAAPSAGSDEVARTAPHRRTFAAPAMFAAAAVLVTFGVVWQPVGDRQAGRILVEEYHPQPEKVWEPTTKPFDTQWYGSESGYNYYCIYDYLSHFYAMSRSEAPLDSATLGGYDVLVIKVPTRVYSAAEIAAIRDFVHRGGGLLLIGEHTNVYHTSDHLNPIATRFGFEFREDCLFGIDSVFEQQYEPPLVPHPIVQHLDRMHFATSCSIDPSWSRGDAVILDTGLKNLLADYHSDNFYPLPEDRAEMRYGAFVQLWSTRHGAGRVTAFTDSTIFSNFCVFDAGKAELMLGMIEWLNHRGPRFPYQSLLLGVGIVIAVISFGVAYARRSDLMLLVTASLLGTSLTIAAAEHIHSSQMPSPQPVRDFVQVNIDRTVSEAPLSRNGFVDGTRDGFGIFERWLLRLGYFTSRREGSGVFDGDLVVLLRPQIPPEESFRAELERYVFEGGKVLVLESARDHSTTNSVLEPFGLAIDASAPADGPLRTEQDWPVVPVAAAVTITGGQPFAWIGGQPVGSVSKHGRGSVTLVGIADRFCDAEMGRSGDVVPDESLQQVFELQFALLRWIVTGANVNTIEAAPDA